MIRIFLIALCLWAGSLSAQPLLPSLDKYLSYDTIHPFAKIYYNGQISNKATDTTRLIADSCTTKNNFARPFYLLQVSRMFMYAEADLAYMLTPACYKTFTTYPDYLVEFLYGKNKYVYADFRKYWAQALAIEHRNSYKDDAADEMKKLKTKLLAKAKKNNKANMVAFFKLIEGN